MCAASCILLSFKPSGLLDLPFLESLPSWLVSALKKALGIFDQDLMSICLKSDATYLGPWSGDYYRGKVPMLHIPNAFNFEAKAEVQLLGLFKVGAAYNMFATQSKCVDMSTPRHLSTHQTFNMVGLKFYYFNFLPWVWDWEQLHEWRLLDSRKGRGGTCKRCGRWNELRGAPSISYLSKESGASGCGNVPGMLAPRCGSKCPGTKIRESGS